MSEWIGHRIRGEVIRLVWATSIAILLLNCISKMNYFMFCILVPWCKCHVSIHIFYYVQFYF